MSDYIGRFAPSPTGPLHLGSLLTAVASYLDARATGGRWLVRIEDLDPPREQAGAAEAIVQALDAHGLHWDGELCWQSHRHAAYQEQLQYWREQGLLYPCACTRRDINAQGGHDVRRCRARTLSPDESVAWRLDLSSIDGELSMQDRYQGAQSWQARSLDDVILQRKDGLYAYQLAVVVDDVAQGITHIVRGLDLLASTPWQLALYRLLEQPAPAYAHLPLVMNAQGQKLSKQNHAQALDLTAASANLYQVLELLGQCPPAALSTAPVGEMLVWAVAHWRSDAVPAGDRVAGSFR